LRESRLVVHDSILAFVEVLAVKGKFKEDETVDGDTKGPHVNGTRLI